MELGREDDGRPGRIRRHRGQPLRVQIHSHRPLRRLSTPHLTQKYKILGYCGFVTLILLIQITCAFKLMNQLTSNEISADKLSLLTISIITIQDFYLTMMHMYFLMTENVHSPLSPALLPVLHPPHLPPSHHEHRI